MSVKVAIASADWAPNVFDPRGMAIPGGANYVRLQQWRPYVDFATVDGTFMYNPLRGIAVIEPGKQTHRDFDVLIMQRLMFKDIKFILRKVMKQDNRPIIINDLDDWYWGLDPSNAAYATCQPNTNPNENIEHYREILALSDVITVSTPFLEEKMKSWVKHPKVVRIDNCVSTNNFAVRSYRNKKPIIGWCGSTAHRSQDLEELQNFFDNSFRFHHTGHVPSSPAFMEALNIEQRRLKTLPPLRPEDYAKRGFPFDIGIVPLSDQPFNDAKSWIKGIEYAAAGVPFIASPRAEYVRLQDTYGIGRIASTREEWLDHVAQLSDGRLRLAEARRQREVVASHLDVRNMANAWNALIASLTS